MKFLYLIIEWLRKRKNSKQYVYGYILRQYDGYRKENVRLNKRTKRVEFVLWKAGEQGHKKDYWYPMGYKWEDYFVAYKNVTDQSQIYKK